MKHVSKFISYFIGFVIVAVLGITLAAYIYFLNSLPNYSGSKTLAGLTDKLTITRDQHALPHIIAQNSNDAYFAVGYSHAQDRLWQMQLHRHIAMGKMSELVGKNGIKTDKFLRNLGMFQAAKTAYPLLSDTVKSQLESYAAGVNAFLAEDHVLPIEFGILQLPKPKPWRPVESVAWMKVMAWDLNSTWRKELSRFTMSADFTPEQIAAYHLPYPGDKPFIPPIPKEIYGFDLKPQNISNIEKAAEPIKISEIIDNQTVDGIGSNNWVISGKMSQTGKPLLANDPHLALTAPALWYHIHVKAEDNSLNAIGATMPGVPYIILGRNDKIAWGFTNAAPDAQDLFVEKITKNGKYKTPDGEADFIMRQEVIKVKGAEDIIINTRATRHGPVISDQLPYIQEILDANHVISMRWTALDNDGRSLDAAARMATAQNWDDFKQAVGYFKAPQQAVVYADTDGNFGFIAPGAVPIRRADNALNGLYPAPGWLAKYDWQGYIPFNELPQKYNPKQSYIATANHKYLDNNYPHYVASRWTLPYRYNRITELLDGKTIHNLDTMAQIQLDQYSKFIENIRPLLAKNIHPAKLQNQASKDAWALIKNWDGRATLNSNAMLIITLWLDNLQEAILAPEFDKKQTRHQLLLEEVLANKNNMAKWCGNDNGKSGTPNDCAQLVISTLAQTLEQLANSQGDDMSKWRWGDVHQASSVHRIFDRVAVLDWLFNIVSPMGGSKTTVNVASYKNTISDNLKKVYKSTHGPSLRHLFDLSDLEKSRYIHSTGQSGNILSNHYSDYTQRWASGKYIPMVMKKANYMPNAIGTLELAPKSMPLK